MGFRTRVGRRRLNVFCFGYIFLAGTAMRGSQRGGHDGTREADTPRHGTARHGRTTPFPSPRFFPFSVAGPPLSPCPSRF